MREVMNRSHLREVKDGGKDNCFHPIIKKTCMRVGGGGYSIDLDRKRKGNGASTHRPFRQVAERKREIIDSQHPWDGKRKGETEIIHRSHTGEEGKG